jgi:uncharacterized protein (DUF427 family)
MTATTADRITITPFAGEVVVTTPAGAEIARTRQALALAEAGYPVVYYVPRADATMDRLARTDHSTGCPYKGAASYFSVVEAGGQIDNAVWSYEEPLPGVTAIAGHLAFYPNKVRIAATPGGA